MPAIALLNAISLNLSIYVGLLILIGGLVGNTLTILVFLSLKTFRQNSCAFYLTAMSFLNIGQLLTSLLPRLMNLWFTIDWTALSPLYCKLRVYLYQVCALASFACMCLATIDQFLATCSSPRLQRISSIKVAYRLFALSMFILILHGIPLLVYQAHVPLSSPNEYTCAIVNRQYQNYHTYGFTLTLVSSLPVGITVLFGCLAYHNVRRLAYRTVPIVRRELDRQLTVMVLVQVFFNFCILLPYIVVYIINLIVILNKDSYGYAQLQLARNITITVFYAYYTVRRQGGNECI